MRREQVFSRLGRAGRRAGDRRARARPAARRARASRARSSPRRWPRTRCGCARRRRCPALRAAARGGGGRGARAVRRRRSGCCARRASPTSTCWRCGPATRARRPTWSWRRAARRRSRRCSRACAEAGAAVVPFGGGTSVVGGVAGERGGFDAVVCLDLARLDGVRAVDPVSRRARGRRRGRGCPELDHALGRARAAARATTRRATSGRRPAAARRRAPPGQASTGFGRFDDLVAAVRCVTPAGELAPLGAPGSAAGPDLTRLVLGSEGTLGVIAELTLRVRPVAEATRYEAWLGAVVRRGLRACSVRSRRTRWPRTSRGSPTRPRRTSRSPWAGFPRVLRERRGDRCLLVAGLGGRARTRSRPGAQRRGPPDRAACGSGAASARAGRRTASTARTCATT